MLPYGHPLENVWVVVEHHPFQPKLKFLHNPHHQIDDNADKQYHQHL